MVVQQSQATNRPPFEEAQKILKRMIKTLDPIIEEEENQVQLQVTMESPIDAEDMPIAAKEGKMIKMMESRTVQEEQS